MHDIIAVWKPKGPTSHDIVDQVRRAARERRVGHAGTLDPLAEGVLVIGIGRAATKRLKDAVAAEKEYEATVRLGMTSTTDDEEGEKKESRNILKQMERTEIERAIKKFVGEIEQVPPAYSAVKVAGRAAYRRARSGEVLALKPRTVEIKRIEILAYRWPNLKLRVITGPGVYIRALARDIGAALGVGGYLASLTRTRVGKFFRENCSEISELLMHTTG